MFLGFTTSVLHTKNQLPTTKDVISIADTDTSLKQFRFLSQNRKKLSEYKKNDFRAQ